MEEPSPELIAQWQDKGMHILANFLSSSPVEIGQRIQQIRIERGKTRQEIADLLDIKVNQYGKIEQGMRQLTLEKIKKIIDFLKIKSEELAPITEEELE